MDDIAGNAKAMLIIGSNTTEQHPIFGTMIRQAIRKRDVKLVVVDPRRIDITEFATLHIRHKPGTDVALLNGLMNIILSNNWHDQEFIGRRTEGFNEFAEIIRQYPPESVSDICGVPVEELHEAAEILATNKPMAVMWAMGITQHTVGVRNVMSLANLQMLLGNMGIPGGGVLLTIESMRHPGDDPYKKKNPRPSEKPPRRLSPVSLKALRHIMNISFGCFQVDSRGSDGFVK